MTARRSPSPRSPHASHSPRAARSSRSPHASRSSSPLARQIYRQLHRRLRSRAPLLTYRALILAIRAAAPSLRVHHRSPHLHAALTEVTLACRAADLPALPALVCRHDTHRPGHGYYKVAHPLVRSDDGRLAAWQRELARVLDEAARFPGALP